MARRPDLVLDGGIICTGETYKDKVKVTFAKGAKLADPKKLFNSSLDGNIRRAIDSFEGDKVDADCVQGARPRRSQAERRRQGLTQPIRTASAGARPASTCRPVACRCC